MIKDREFVSVSEAVGLLEKSKLDNPELVAHLKKFSELSPENALKMKDGLKNLNILKINDEHIVKIIDTLPEDSSDLNKIFVDMSLDEDESKKVLEIVKQNR